jgi:hypothetical protein
MKSVFKRLSTGVVRRNDAKLTAVCIRGFHVGVDAFPSL